VNNYDDQYGPIPGKLLQAMVDQDMAGESIKVALALLLHCSPSNPQCNPGQRTLSELSGVHKRHLSRAIGRLVDAGLLSTMPGAGKRTTIYRFEVWIDPPEHSKAGKPKQAKPKQPDTPNTDPRIKGKLAEAGVSGANLNKAAANPHLSYFMACELIEQAEGDSSIRNKAGWIAQACIKYSGEDQYKPSSGIMDELEERADQAYRDYMERTNKAEREMLGLEQEDLEDFRVVAAEYLKNNPDTKQEDAIRIRGELLAKFKAERGLSDG